jgi:pyruvate dehydrogenase E2 component (dihydrolipoyllysine-residue acetyltransferase)
VARVLRMPEVADDPTSATLTAWLVGESGDFAGAQSIATVETDTSLLSIEVAEPGVLLKSLVEPGDLVQPGSALAVLGSPGEVVEDVEQLMVRLGLDVAPEAQETGAHLRAVPSGDPLYATTWPHEPTLIDVPATDVPATDVPATDVPATDVPATDTATVEVPDEETAGDPVRRVVGWADSVAEAVMDAVLDVETKTVEPQAVETPQVKTPPVDGRAEAATEADEAEPSPRALRQLHLREVVRADEVLDIVGKVDEVSLLAMVVKAVAVTSRTVALQQETTSITDVAVQRWTPAGTVAPVVHVANLMTVSSLAATLADLDSRAYEGRIATGELEPASVTVVDVGTEGVAEGVIDATSVHPAVLTVGSVRVQPVVEGRALVPGRVVALSLSCDAQRIEAAAAARWLAHLAGLLEQPLQFLT